MGRPLSPLLALIAFIAIAVPSWLVLRYGRETPEAILAARFQSLAERACRCARVVTGNAGKAACWHEFEARAARIGPLAEDGDASPCAGFVPHRRCFGETQLCVTVGYSGYNTGLEPDDICTGDEAASAGRLLESIAPDDQNGRRTTVAMHRLLDDFIQGRHATGGALANCGG